MNTTYKPEDAMEEQLDIPAVTLLAWTHHEDGLMAYHAARHPNLPGEVLATLSTSPLDSVRKGVLGNPSTPPEVLVNMLRNPNLHPRFDLYLELALNPSAPRECVLAVIEHGDEEARGMLALNLRDGRGAASEAASELGAVSSGN